MTIKEAINLATELKNKHYELRSWSITLHNKKRSFGTCSHSKMEIQLSQLLIPTMTDAGIKDTILHEIAHALTRGHGHDYIWKCKCIELGCSPQRVAGYDKLVDGKESMIQFYKDNAKYMLTCPTCGQEIFKHRKPKRIGSCGLHGGFYDVKHKLILTQNY